LLGGPGADGNGAGHGAGGDLATIGEGASLGRLEGAGEEALGDLGEDELDGGMVFKEGHDNFGALFGALGAAVVLVGMAEVLAADGGGVALEAVDAEGAAAAGFLGEVGSFGWRRVEVGHGEILSKRARSVKREAKSEHRKASSEKRAVGAGKEKASLDGEAISSGTFTIYRLESWGG
jgi:hypothetical protein